jgi:hypothetical protein
LEPGVAETVEALVFARCMVDWYKCRNVGIARFAQRFPFVLGQLVRLAVFWVPVDLVEVVGGDFGVSAFLWVVWNPVRGFLVARVLSAK